MRALVAGLAATLLAWSPASSEVAPKPGQVDPRLQVVDYDPDQIVALKVAFGYSLTVELAPDERIETVTLGNSAVWQVTANHDADHLFIKPMQGAVDTNLTVLTDERTYNFILKPVAFADPTIGYFLRFNYGPTPTASSSPTGPHSVYRLGGAKRLRPLSISDDGRSTSLVWGADAPTPAIFIVNDRGQESLINGAMQGDRYVIDGVGEKLVFRLGDEEAFAIRRVLKGKRP
jgi:type IV secretion system protein VirB9